MKGKARSNTQLETRKECTGSHLTAWKRTAQFRSSAVVFRRSSRARLGAEAYIDGEERRIPDRVPRYDSKSDDDSSVAEVDEKLSCKEEAGPQGPDK